MCYYVGEWMSLWVYVVGGLEVCGGVGGQSFFWEVFGVALCAWVCDSDPVLLQDLMEADMGVNQGEVCVGGDGLMGSALLGSMNEAMAEM